MFFLLFIWLMVAQLADSKDFPKEMQMRAVAGTVRVVNMSRKVEGTGAIIGSDASAVYVLTANHIVDKADRIEVSTFSAASYPQPEKTYRDAKIVARLSDLRDLALLRVVTTDRMPGRMKLCPDGRVPQGEDFPVLTVGCAGGAPVCLLDSVKAKRLVRRPPGNETAVFWELSKEPTAGRSGGPVLDRNGYVIGIGSGRNKGRGYYCHIDEIRRFLKQNRVEWLYEQDSEKP